jgi:hypothetical protein
MIFYSIIFSLHNPEENMYVWMFDLLLKTLIKTDTFTSKDTYYILADTETKMAIMNRIDIENNVHVLDIPKPKSLLEGMLWKYKLHTLIDIETKDCMYLDVDILSMRKFQLTMQPDTFYVLPESSAENTDYCGCWKLNLNKGLSAGFFAFNLGPNVKKTFEAILDLEKTTKESFYTIEQPFFNKCIENAPYKLFDESVVSLNGNTNTDTCYFLSYAGVPGNQEFHWQKGHHFYLQYCS